MPSGEVSVCDQLGVITLPSHNHPYLCLLHHNLKKGIRIFPWLRPRSLFRIIFNKKKPRLIHLHWIEYYFRKRSLLITIGMSIFFLLSLIFGKVLLRLKTMITLHNVIPHESFFPIIEHSMFTATLRLADVVIVHNNFSKEMAEILYKVQPKKIWVIPHGNFVHYFPDNVTSIEARKILDVPRRRTIFLFFGAVMYYKGIDLLLEAFESILQTRKDIFFIIAGPCEDRDLMSRITAFNRRFSSDTLVRLRHIHKNEVPIFLKAADIGVVPYLEISTPGSLLLFMSFGKAVVVPRLRPIQEMVREDFVVLFEPKDANSLKEALIKAAESTTSAYMGKAAFEEAKKYNWKKIAERTLLAYDAALRGKTS